MRLPRAAQALNLTLATMAIALVVGAGTSAAAPKLQLDVADGALTLANSNDGAAILHAERMRPGGEASGSVLISNTGTVAGSLRLALTDTAVDTPGVGGGRLSTRLDLRVVDVTNAQAPVTLYAGRLAAMPSVAVGAIAPAGQRRFLFVATLPSGGTADNAFQGAQLAAGYTWTAQGAALPTPSPTPVPTPVATPIATPAGPGTSPTTPPPPPVTTPPPGVSGPPVSGGTLGDQVFSMPSSRRCVSRRKFAIHIRRRKGVTFSKVTITVNGKTKVRVKGLKARKLKTTINLRGLPKGKVVVRVVAVTTSGAKLSSTRKYHTCTTKKRTKKRATRRR